MAWYDSAWTKRKPITNTGGTDGVQTAYQMKYAVTYDSDMKSDFSDLRFTKLDGTTILDSWMESHIASTSAVVWVETDTPANGVDADIYMYYGNSGAASDWNITDTFLFGDDFDAYEPDWFASDGISQPTHGLIVPSGTYYNNKTFIVWHGASLDPYGIEYNHSTGLYGSAYKVGTNPLGNDDHGGPAILRDSSGYLHVFYGSHGTSTCAGDTCYTQHAKSTNTDDISAWTDKGNIGPSGATYSKPLLVSSDIYLFVRDEQGSNNFDESYIKSTDNGENWNSAISIISPGSGYATYTGKVVVEGTSKIHVSWNFHDYSDSKRKSVYHAYLNLSDLHMYSIGGTDLGTTISKTEADTYCRAVDTGTNECNFVRVGVDSFGTPYLIYLHDDSGWKLKFTKWNGSSWDTPTTISTSNDQFNGFDFVVHSSSSIELYFTNGAVSGRGGDCEKWLWNGSLWTKDSTVLDDSVYGKSLNHPSIVNNYNSDAKVVFGEYVGDYTTQLKAFLHGDSGLVSANVDEIDTTKWDVSADITQSVANSILTHAGDNVGVDDISTDNAVFLVDTALRMRHKFGTLDYVKSVGGVTTSGSNSSALSTRLLSRSSFSVTKLQSGDNSSSFENIDMDADYAADYHIFEIQRYSAGAKAYVDDVLKATASTYYHSVADYVSLIHYEANEDSFTDWVLVRKYVANPATYAFGSEEDAPANPYWYYKMLRSR